ncbi:fimbrial protein [Morganella morganii]
MPAADGLRRFLHLYRCVCPGEIFIAPCKINQGNNILIDFKDVTTTRIDNDNYREKLDYRIECQDNRARAMKLYITGTSSSVDSRYLSTSVSDLAVKFLADNKLMPVNSMPRPLSISIMNKEL